MIKLRDYQLEAVAAGLKHLSNQKPKGAGLMILPTGSGKSLVIAGIANALQEPTLVFQPSKEILEQNYGKYTGYGAEASIYSASAGRKEIGPVTFATIGSVIRKRHLFDHFRKVIIDECHLVNAKGGMYQKFLAGTGARVVGLTATPYRLATFRSPFTGEPCSMLRFLTRTRPRVFSKVIHVTQNATLFERGYLAHIDYKPVEGFDSSKLAVNSTGAEFADRSVDQYFKATGFEGQLAKVVLKLLNAGRKNVLVFTRRTDTARDLSMSLGPKARYVYAETPKKEREQIIEGFRSGEIRVVTNVGILTTGFDYPELETIVIARPTMSLALYYQMVGRGLRPHPDKASTVVVDMCDNIRRFGRIEDLRLIEPKSNLWHISGGDGRQLTNIRFGERSRVF